MEPESGEFAPNDEVDDLRWLTPDEARALLTHDRDSELLRDVSI
jgi:8-oxo-dGTP diphosphatase